MKLSLLLQQFTDYYYYYYCYCYHHCYGNASIMCLLQAWLGLSYVDAAALWSLFVAFGASIIQV